MTVFTAIVELTRASWRVFRRYPRLMWFPILSLAATLVAIAMLPPVLGGRPEWWLIAVMMFTVHAIHVYFNVALTHESLRALRGESAISLRSGLTAATGRAPAVAAYAAITGSFGLLLALIGQTRHPIVRLVRALLGTAWSLVTYLAIPVLVQERRGATASLRRSGELFRRTWGETALSEVGVRVIAQHALVIVFVVALVIIGLLGDDSLLALLLIIALAAVAIGVIGALEAIYRAALYVFAAEGAVPEPFAGGALDEVWRTRPATPPAPPEPPDAPPEPA